MELRTIDFRPVAQPGWRVIFLEPEQGWRSRPLAGWLIRDQIETTVYDGEHPTGEREVIAAVMSDGPDPEPVTWAGDAFWLVLGPGEDDPTAVQELEQREYLVTVRQARARHAQTAAKDDTP